MKQSQVKPGVVAMLSLGGRRGAVRVTVVELIARPSVLCSQPQWRVQSSSGEWYQVTPRQLKPMPAPTDRHGNAILASMRADALKLAPGRPGQTIDAGDVLIETTLHRLG